MSNRRERGEELEKRLEDVETLRGLLELAGSRLAPEAVVALFRERQAQGDGPGQVFPSLFDDEPRFEDPSYARRLYGNLFGLWDLVKQGRGLPVDRGERPRRERSTPPPPWSGEPDPAWLALASEHLARSEGRELGRLQHAFENREDALLAYLDEEGFSDAAFLRARGCLFELFALIELGRSEGAGAAMREHLGRGAPVLPAPESLRAHAAALLQRASPPSDETAPSGEAERVLGLIERALGAFWQGRKTR